MFKTKKRKVVVTVLAAAMILALVALSVFMSYAANPPTARVQTLYSSGHQFIHITDASGNERIYKVTFSWSPSGTYSNWVGSARTVTYGLSAFSGSGKVTLATFSGRTAQTVRQSAAGRGSTTGNYLYLRDRPISMTVPAGQIASSHTRTQEYTWDTTPHYDLYATTGTSGSLALANHPKGGQTKDMYLGVHIGAAMLATYRRNGTDYTLGNGSQHINIRYRWTRVNLKYYANGATKVYYNSTNEWTDYPSGAGLLEYTPGTTYNGYLQYGVTTNTGLADDVNPGIVGAGSWGLYKTGYHANNYWRMGSATGPKISAQQVMSGQNLAQIATAAGVTTNINSADATLNLYADYDPNIYYINYDKNASDATGTMSKSTFVYDQDEKLKANQFHRDGYVFAGWAVAGSPAPPEPDEQDSEILDYGYGMAKINGQWYCSERIDIEEGAVIYTLKQYKNGEWDTLYYGTSTPASTNEYYSQWNTAWNNRTAANHGADLGSDDVVYTDGETVRNLTPDHKDTIFLKAIWKKNIEVKIDDKDVEITVDPSDSSTSYTLVNPVEPVTDAEFIKKDTNGNVVPGAKFRLTGTSDSGVEIGPITATSNNNGKVIFEDLPAGRYTLKETSVPEGWLLDETEHTLLVEHLGTKYSHTPNITDDGVKESDYEPNLALNDVITISGANKVNVKITTGGQGTSYDYACVWKGSQPSYTAASNSGSSISGKLGGTALATNEYSIDGNAVTFGYKSNASGVGSGTGKGYGYYAVVDGWKTGIVEEREQDLSGEAYAVFDSADGSLKFFRDDAGKYTNGQTDGTKTYYTGVESTGSHYTYIPWYSQRTNITSVTFEDPIAPNQTCYWFYDMSNITSITGLEKLDTSNVKSMSYMFYDCSGLTSLDVSYFDTSKVTNMSDMFRDCSGLTSLDVSHFDTSNVTNMSRMFRDCTNLTSLDLSTFDTSNVTSMSYMFYHCEALESLEIENFDISSVTTMVYMFNYCYKVTATLNMSRTDQSFTDALKYAARDAGQLTLKYISPVTSSGLDEWISTAHGVTDANVVNGGAGMIKPIKQPVVRPGIVTDEFINLIEPKGNVKLIKTDKFDNPLSNAVFRLFGESDHGTPVNKTVTSDENGIVEFEDMFCGTYDLVEIKAPDGYRKSDDTWKARINEYESGYEITVDIDQPGDPEYSELAIRITKNDSPLSDADVYTTNNIYIGTTTALGRIDMSGEDAEDTINSIVNNTVIVEYNSKTSGEIHYGLGGTEFAFGEASTITTSNGKEVQKLDGTYAIKNDKYSTDVVITKVLDDDHTYVIPEAVYELSGTSADGTPVSQQATSDENGKLVFKDIPIGDDYTIKEVQEPGGYEIDENEYKVGITYERQEIPGEAYAVFDSSDGSLKFFRDDAGKYTNGQTSGTKTYYTGVESTGTTSSSVPWYSQRANVTSVIFEDVIVPAQTAYWFCDMENLTSITDLDKLDTSNVTNMSSMFSGCYDLTSLDVSHFDTSNVTDMSAMFAACISLSSLDVSHFDTSNVTDMGSMFYTCVELTALDVSHFDTSKVTFMGNMFTQCYDLTTLDVSHFDTSKVTYMHGMFSDCSHLTTSLNIMKMPSMMYSDMCKNTASASGAQVTLYYIAPATSANVDTLVNTKSSNSNVVNGGAGTFTAPTAPTPPASVREKEGKVVISHNSTELGKLTDGDYYVEETRIPIETGKLSIKKINEDNEPIQGAIFKLSGLTAEGEQINGMSSNPVETPATGVVTFNNIPEGEYTLEETYAPHPYFRKFSKYEVTVDENGTTYVYDTMGRELLVAKKTDTLVLNIKNGTQDPDTSSFRIVKTDKSTGKPLPNATFTLTGTRTLDDETFEYSRTSSSDGNMSFTNLYDGTYTLIETPPDGYYAINPITVTIVNNEVTLKRGTEVIEPSENGDVPIYKIEDPKYPDLKIHKINDKDDNLAGATYKLIDANSTEDKYDVQLSTTDQCIYIYETGTNVLTSDEITIEVEDKGSVSTTTGVILLSDFVQFNAEDEEDEEYTPSASDYPAAGDKATVYTDTSSTDITLSTTKTTISVDKEDIYSETATTSYDGIATFKSLPAGNYYLMEDEAPAGYAKLPTVYSVTVTEDKATITSPTLTEYENGYEIIDPELNTSVAVRKQDMSGTDLAGAVYQMTGMTEYGDYLIKNTTSGANGIGVFRNIPVGSYVVKEVTAPTQPTQYNLSDEEFTIDVMYDEDLGVFTYDISSNMEDETSFSIINGIPTFIAKDTTDPPLKVIKTDEDTGERLYGAEFTVYDGNGDAIKTITTDDNGVATFEKLPSIGTLLTIKETESPNGYGRKTDTYYVSIDTTNEQPYTVRLNSASGTIQTLTNEDEVKAFTVTNKRLEYSFKIKKTDSVTGNALQGAEFTITESGSENPTPVSAITGNDGYATFEGLTPGEYNLTETIVPAHHIDEHKYWSMIVEEPADSNASPVTVYEDGVALPTSKDGSVFYTTITNPPGYDVNIRKFKKGTTQYISSVNFSLYNSEGDYVDSFMSGNAAQTFCLPTGTYTLIEEEPPEGYNIATPITFTVSSTGAITSTTTGAVSGNTVTVYDEPKTGTLTFNKVSDLGNPVPGATFTLTGTSYLGTNITKTAVSQPDGSVTFTDVEIGDEYTVTETGVPRGYEGDDTVFHAIIGEENSALYKENDDDEEVEVTEVENTQTTTYSDVVIKKNVVGSLGDLTKNFNFTLTLTDAERNRTYTATKGNTTSSITTDASGAATYTFTLKDDESISVANLPDGSRYVVTEGKSDHIASYMTNTDISGSNSEDSLELATSSLTVGTDSIVTFTNERTIASMTGVPTYLSILIIALAFIVQILTFVYLKKKSGLDLNPFRKHTK